MNDKDVVISCGPIPARLDSVKVITNQFKGGLAFKTAEYLANQGHPTTVIVWKGTTVPENITRNPNIKEIIRVKDVFEYYDWFVANAKNHSAFVMAAAVANLTPVKPYEGKFPSHMYKPGDEFDIKFMIAPRAIDAIKAVNPRACLIGYKLFDEPDDDKLIEIARHTLADAKANLIFANRPSDAKTRKIAVTADNSAFECSFDQHLELIHRAINQTYFKTEVTPLTEDERNSPELKAAMELVKKFEATFPKYGTIAIPVFHDQFVTTSRGHRNKPVLVRHIDYENHTIQASAKATLNAPALKPFVDQSHYAIHRHFDDPKADKTCLSKLYHPNNYLFPGTAEEAIYAQKAVRHNCEGIKEIHHGYIRSMPFEDVNWPEYHETFPEKYFSVPEAFMKAIWKYEGKETLEIGGNNYPNAKYAYDPFVAPKNNAIRLTEDGLRIMHFDFAFCRNAICYLHPDKIKEILNQCDAFMANAPAVMPDFKSTENEVSAKIKTFDDTKKPDGKWFYKIWHYLLLPDDRIMFHTFFAYDEDFYKSLGLDITKYGKNSVLITKGVEL